jgi:hypothetical protein
MDFLGRPVPTLSNMHYKFDVTIPADRVGHHVLWIAWHRDDPVGEVFFSTSDLMITAAAPSLPGDYNANGKVDAADYTAWRNRLGAAAGTLPNDANGGMIGTAQYATWKANFGDTLPGAAGASSSQVPEPGVWFLMAFGTIACPLWRGGRGSL